MTDRKSTMRVEFGVWVDMICFSHDFYMFVRSAVFVV